MIGDDDIEDWDDFEEVDLSKKRYVSDEQRNRASENQKRLWKDPEYRKQQLPKIKKLTLAKHSPESKKLIGKISREIWLNQRVGIAKKFFEKCKTVHGDRYDYSKTNYVNVRNRIKVICRVHGEFFVFPTPHVRQMSGGCKECNSEFIGKRVKDEWDNSNGVSQRTYSEIGKKRMLKNLGKGRIPKK